MSSKNVQFWFKDLVSNKVKSMSNLKFNEIKQAYRHREVYYTTGFMIKVCCPGPFVREGGTEGRGDARSMTDCSPCFPDQGCRTI